MGDNDSIQFNSNDESFSTMQKVLLGVATTNVLVLGVSGCVVWQAFIGRKLSNVYRRCRGLPLLTDDVLYYGPKRGWCTAMFFLSGISQVFMTYSVLISPASPAWNWCLMVVLVALFAGSGKYQFWDCWPNYNKWCAMWRNPSSVERPRSVPVNAPLNESIRLSTIMTRVEQKWEEIRGSTAEIYQRVMTLLNFGAPAPVPPRPVVPAPAPKVPLLAIEDRKSSESSGSSGEEEIVRRTNVSPAMNFFTKLLMDSVILIPVQLVVCVIVAPRWARLDCTDEDEKLWPKECYVDRPGVRKRFNKNYIPPTPKTTGESHEANQTVQNAANTLSTDNEGNSSNAQKQGKSQSSNTNKSKECSGNFSNDLDNLCEVDEDSVLSILEDPLFSPFEEPLKFSLVHYVAFSRREKFKSNLRPTTVFRATPNKGNYLTYFVRVLLDKKPIGSIVIDDSGGSFQFTILCYFKSQSGIGFTRLTMESDVKGDFRGLKGESLSQATQAEVINLCSRQRA